MKFLIRRTSQAIEPYTKEIENLDALLSFLDNEAGGTDLIIRKGDFAPDLKYEIEIYDDYRE